MLNLVPERQTAPANAAVMPIRATRAVAAVGREIKFKTEVRLAGPEGGKTPTRVTFEADGRPAGEQPLPPGADKGRIPITFSQRFATGGSHLVTVKIEGDPLPGDDRQDFAVEVLPAVPVLIVDADGRSGPRSSDFLRRALAPAVESSPAFLVRVVSVNDFAADLLVRPLTREPASIPRVLILANVPRLRPDQQQAVEKFLADGGGVLATLGARSDAAHANAEWFRDGRGWLPARLVEAVGDVGDLDRAARPVVESLVGPFGETFREGEAGDIAAAKFPRHWRLALARTPAASRSRR